MLLPRPRSLREHIVHALASRPLLSAIALEHALKLQGLVVTKQGLYKELRALLRDSVVVKYQQSYSLSIPWIINFSQFADQMFDNYMGQSNLSVYLPSDKNRASWTFTNLTMLNDFWVELIFCALNENPQPIVYNWIPHPWWVLLQSLRTKTFNEGIKNAQCSLKTILGHDFPLDKAYAKFQAIQNPHDKISFSKSPFHGQDETYFEVIGEFLITLKIHPQVVALISRFFSTSHENFDGQWAADATAHLRAARFPCRLRIERRTPNHRRILRAVQEYWTPEVNVSAKHNS